MRAQSQVRGREKIGNRDYKRLRVQGKASNNLDQMGNICGVDLAVWERTQTEWDHALNYCQSPLRLIAMQTC
jgi:hypothetical protein